VSAPTGGSARRSAGILLHRGAGSGIEVLLVHPGGPLWAARDAGSWSIPKGEPDGEEDALACALREFAEETGTRLVDSTPLSLGEVRQRSGKLVAAWAVEGDLDAAAIRSNTFRLEWPPRSGVLRDYPEVDRAAWFDLDEARSRILPAQEPLLDRLRELLARGA
jgi:predicted NUDIX family NTP pyrophosphohydrolase